MRSLKVRLSRSAETLPIILDALITDIKQLSTKPSEMDFLESGNQTEGRIYKGFGVNPISAGQVDGSNRASSAIADHHLLANTVNPILALIGQVVTKWVAPQFANDGESMVFWLQAAEPHDPELTLKKWEFAAKNYAVDRNDIRSYLGLPQWKSGDSVGVPMTVEFEQVT